MSKYECFRTYIAGFDIVLSQDSSGDFEVAYGKQVTKNLPYYAAAAELGHCIMHALACESKLFYPERVKP